MRLFAATVLMLTLAVRTTVQLGPQIDDDRRVRG
jgi:hypothetical protein